MDPDSEKHIAPSAQAHLESINYISRRDVSGGSASTSSNLHYLLSPADSSLLSPSISHIPDSSAANSQALQPNAAFSFTQSDLKKLIQKTGSVSAGTGGHSDQANSSSSTSSQQLYLLVPSNYPVIVTMDGGIPLLSEEDRSGQTEGQSLSTVAASPLSPAAITATTLEGHTTPLSTGGLVPSAVAPSKNATALTPSPMLLRPFKDVVPSLSLEDRKASEKFVGGSCETLQHLSLLALTHDAPFSGEGATALDPHDGTLLDNRFASSTQKVAGPNASEAISRLQGVASDQTTGRRLAHHVVNAEKEDDTDDSENGGPRAGRQIKSSPTFPMDDSMISSPVFFASSASSPSPGFGNRAGVRGGGGDRDSKTTRRRVSHNEVERRRRDRINTHIADLYKLLPPEQQVKSQSQSKGVVLRRVFDYFRTCDATMKELQDQISAYEEEVRRLTRENHSLRNSLGVHFQQQRVFQEKDAHLMSIAPVSSSSSPPTSSPQQHSEPNPNTKQPY